MSKSIRTTIILDEILHTKIRKIQAKRIEMTKKPASFSATVNLLLAKQLGVRTNGS